MRKFFNNFKKSCKRFMTGKSGFSLVELIVVIAIMAVMAAVLAPALLGYVEKSRMQKDDSTMDEVVNAIQLSLADQAIYDEVLEHSVWDNVSCYIDKKDESQFADCKVQLKAANGDKKEQYMFGDEARLLDETVYYAAGNMRGLTITFSPSESGDTYDFANGILNKFVGRKTGLLSENPELYNRLRSVIGDKLDTTSQTYRNSDYTIFIRVGSTGGAEAVQQDAIQVWGQFNGTNLAEKDHKYELSSGRVVGSAGANDATNSEIKNNENSNLVDFSESSDLNHRGVIPVGATYTIKSTGEVLEAGEKFPETMENGDRYDYEDYYYIYYFKDQYIKVDKWRVCVKDKTKTEYSAILESINEEAITSLSYTFNGCYNMIKSPDIPSTIINVDNAFEGCNRMICGPDLSKCTQITSLYWTFANCHNMQTYAGSNSADGDFSKYTIPSGVTSFQYAFHYCKKMVIPPKISHCTQATNFISTFSYCENLKVAPTLPLSATTLEATFSDCKKLLTYEGINSNITNGNFSQYVIPSGVTRMDSMFARCELLTESPDVPVNIKYMQHTFTGCKSLIKAPNLSNCTKLQYLKGAFYNCKALINAPTIPSCVIDMNSTFEKCESLEGTITINANIKNYSTKTDYYAECFKDTKKDIVITGSNKTILNKLASTATKGNVTVQ